MDLFEWLSEKPKTMNYIKKSYLRRNKKVLDIMKTHAPRYYEYTDEVKRVFKVVFVYPDGKFTVENNRLIKYV